MTEVFELATGFNTISAIMVFPDGAGGNFPCVILSHGLISSKESTKYVALSDLFAQKGIASCRFDYHGCGESGGCIEETTLSIRLDNLNAVFDHVSRNHRIDASRVGIIGSSFGGTTGLLKASRDPRVRCLSLWATPYRLEKEGDGSLDGIAFADDIYRDFGGYDILAEARKIHHVLVVHGDMDETVPCIEGKRIYQEAREPKRLEIIKGGDHVFSNPLHRENVMGIVLQWFGQYL